MWIEFSPVACMRYVNIFPTSLVVRSHKNCWSVSRSPDLKFLAIPLNMKQYYLLFLRNLVSIILNNTLESLLIRVNIIELDYFNKNINKVMNAN